MNYRIGFGIDFHQLVEAETSGLAESMIPFAKRVDGPQRYADVLLHAISYALLGALALGDIVSIFQIQNSAYKMIDSKILLERTFSLIKDTKYTVVNVDFHHLPGSN
jgi:2-C-methyl-D-erythritol 2,4-cyclodiphosphate synthase